MRERKTNRRKEEKRGRAERGVIEREREGRGKKVRARTGERAGLFWVSGATSTPHFTV